MFNLGSFEQRLKHWAEFRNSLEQSSDPLKDVADYYSSAPLVSINTDPWNQSVWPSAWELISENQYCSFCITLGMCYTLQLTERFKSANFEIHISKDNTNSSIHYYLLFENDMVIGYEEEKIMNKTDLPTSLYSQRIYTMKPIQ